MAKLKLTNSAVTAQIRTYIEMMNERFSDRKFRMHYAMEDPTDPFHEVVLQYSLNADGQWLAVTRPMPKKQLFEAIKLLDLGSYMFQESIGNF
tara:strand:+ start:733 stop:1011 length:279 start_codon:yes stop_codon:yes gene_type:complete